MARKPAKRVGISGNAKSKPSAAPGPRVKKIHTYEDTLEDGGVDDCESNIPHSEV